MSQATATTTTTKIVTHSTITSDVSEEMTLVLKVDDDGAGSFVIEDFEEIAEFSVDDLDSLIEMLLVAQGICKRLSGMA